VNRNLWRPAALAAGLILSLGAGIPAGAQNPAAATVTAADFARAAAISSVSLSPDGKHIVALTSQNGVDVQMSVWETAAPQKPPKVVGSTRMRFLNAGFIKNDRILITAIQPFTLGATKSHITKQYVTDLEGSEFRSLLPERSLTSEQASFLGALVDAQIISILPRDPQNVLVVDQRLDSEGDIYRVNIYNGQASRVERAGEKVVDVAVDLKGEVRVKSTVDFDDGKVYFAQLIKNPANQRWEEHFRWYARDRIPIDIVGFDADPNIIYVRTARERDKTGIYEYDIAARKFREPLFEHKLFDANAMYTSKDAKDFGRILGFSYSGAGSDDYWADEGIRGLVSSARRAMGVTTTPVAWTDPGTGEKASIQVASGADVSIIDLSDDRSVAILVKRGPKQPPEYYLSRNGQISLLGKARPWIDTAALGDTRLVEYAARDGLMIPAFLTTPPAKFGPGPHPAIVLPHGGPWARDVLDWDGSGWPQYLASRGYVVLQPQFRGSLGWGQKLWRAGDGEWGQKMQDDKDDGAKWLIEQKLAAADRIAMFGYSYGGYAALAATIRPNGLYQCAISGAGAGDLASIRRATFDNRYQREFQNPTIQGLDALAKAGQAKIPVFIYHGDRDQTVELKQSKKFVDALQAAGLPYKFLEIKDMGHQGATMVPAMLETQLVEIEKYLKEECGPGGL
jgi:dipeptidyl aminopeptidase/acylaminoacyl peptidase